MTVFVNTMSNYKDIVLVAPGAASMVKVLIIRFSSIGDLTQALSIPSHIKTVYPNAEIHFVTRSDLSQIVDHHPHVAKVWSLDRSTGFSGLVNLIRELRNENFTHIYDAHNNLRSFFIRKLVRSKYKLTRSLMRINRFLLLNFHINRFEKPFSGQRDLLKPLENWGIKFKLPAAPQLFLPEYIKASAKKLLNQHSVEHFIVLVPSAAYELKRWPVEYWSSLIDKNQHLKFVILGGPQDQFTQIFESRINVVNLAAKTDLLTSAAVIEKSIAVVANDTGLLHFAEQLGKPTIALMGPAPFGFPSRTETTVILERDLSCRPCSKHGQGPCKNKDFQICLKSITPEEVSRRLNKMLDFQK